MSESVKAKGKERLLAVILAVVAGALFCEGIINILIAYADRYQYMGGTSLGWPQLFAMMAWAYAAGLWRLSGIIANDAR